MAFGIRVCLLPSVLGGKNKEMDGGHEVRRRRSVESTEDRSSRAVKVSTRILMKNWR